jgi:hypothetical protein
MTERSANIEYINQHVTILSKADKQNILQIILNNVSDDKIISKGDGSQVKFADLDDSCVKSLADYIKAKTDANSATLKLI